MKRCLTTRKTLLLLLLLSFSWVSLAQQVTYTSPKTLSPIVRDKAVKVKTVNLLDVDPQFKRKSIRFVPFKATKEAEKQGLKLDSIYVWADPDGNSKRASGKQILEGLNAFEKELNKRGHSLRDKETFKNIRVDMQQVQGGYVSAPKVVLQRGNQMDKTLFLDKRSVAALKSIGEKKNQKAGSIAEMIDPARTRVQELPKLYSFLYFGQFEVLSGEIRDQLVEEHNMELTREKKSVTVPLSIVTMPHIASEIGKYEILLYLHPDDPKPRYRYMLDFKPIADYEITERIRSRQIRADHKPGTHNRIYYLKKDFKTGGFGIPPAGYEPKYYYAQVLLYDKKGKLMDVPTANMPVLANYIQEWSVPNDHWANIDAFRSSITDPVTGTFGFYMKSDGFSSYAHHYWSGRNKIVEDTTRIDGHFDVGITMYNWANLFDKSKSKTTDMSLFNIDISGVNGRTMSTQKKAPKNNRTDIGKDKNIKVYYQIIGEKRKQLTSSIVQPYTQVLFDQRFFLGPVPCRATVTMEGKFGINYGGYTSLGETSVISTVIEPYVNLNIHGSGGADAVVAYAKITAHMDLFNASVPMNFFAESDRAARVDSKIELSGFDGNIGFKAGICIPIPFFDDLCKEFRITIFNWDGMSDTIEF